MRILDCDAALRALNPGFGAVFREWLFHPGMLFGSERKWWGDFGQRGSFHEGVDFCFFRTVEGAVQHIGRELLFPAILPGRLAGCIDDLLGQTLILKHSDPSGRSWPLYSLYSHARPLNGLRIGQELDAGAAVAAAAKPKRSVPGMPAHIHLSVLRLDPDYPAHKLSWKRINAREGVILEDPLAWLDCRYVLDGELDLSSLRPS